MTEFVVLDVGMGGLVVLFGGAALILFLIAAIVIVRISIKAIKKEIRHDACENADSIENTENADEEV